MSHQSVFIVAGEASGDLHGANLARELRQLAPEVQLRGMGGASMRAAGIELLVDSSSLAVVGIVEVLASYRKIKAVLEQIKQTIHDDPPDLLILIDYQEFNQRLAAYARSIGIKVLFYIGPQVWAWRPKRVYKMAKIVDQMAVIFPFEVPLYKEAKVPVTFTGHPLVDEVVHDKNRDQAIASLAAINPAIKAATTIALLPGSRQVELKRLLPIQLECAQRLRKDKPQLQFILPLANSLQLSDLAPYQQQLDALNVIVLEHATYDAVQASDCAIVASGTATLEIGLLGTPMVIIHKIAPLSYFILRRLVKLKHIGLVNIVPGKEIVKEFIQHEATPDNIVAEVLHILDDQVYNKAMRAELDKLRPLLGEAGGSKNVAKLAFDMLNKTDSRQPAENN
jgi:lipid-A-disaccharide synthase